MKIRLLKSYKVLITALLGLLGFTTAGDYRSINESTGEAHHTHHL